MLPLAARIGETQVDVFDVVVLDRFQDVFGGLHEYPFWFTGGRDLAAAATVVKLNTIGGSSIQYQTMLDPVTNAVGSQFRSDRVQPGFSGADADRLFDVGHEDLAVADAPGLGRAADGVDRPLDQIVPDHDLDFHLGQEVHDIFGAAIESA